MKQYLQRWREQYWKPLQYRIRRFIKGKDDDDHPYDHPWVIL